MLVSTYSIVIIAMQIDYSSNFPKVLIGSKSAISLQRRPVGPKFQVEGVPLTNHSSCQKTRLNDLSYSRKIWTCLFFRFVTNHAFDRQTDGQTEFSLLDRVCILCIAVKTRMGPYQWYDEASFGADVAFLCDEKGQNKTNKIQIIQRQIEMKIIKHTKINFASYKMKVIYRGEFRKYARVWKMYMRVLYCTMPVRDGLYTADRCSRAWYTDAWRTDRTLLGTRRSVLVSAIDVWHARCITVVWIDSTAT